MTVNASRRAEQRRVVGERILRLCHADGQVAEAQLLYLLYLLYRVAHELHAVGVVDLCADGGQLVHDTAVQLVALVEVVRLFAEAYNFGSERPAAFAALGPDFA